MLLSGRFQARYRPRHGKEIRAPQTFETRAEAEEWLEQLRLDIEAGRYGK